MFQHDCDRIVLTDHGAFVLLNVYVPNAGDRSKNGGERAGFKCRFLVALKEKADSLQASGREVTLPLTHIATSNDETRHWQCMWAMFSWGWQ
jgi:exonuclease III